MVLTCWLWISKKRQITFVMTFIAPEMRRKGATACKCDSCTKDIVSLVHSPPPSARCGCAAMLSSLIQTTGRDLSRCSLAVVKTPTVLKNAGCQGLPGAPLVPLSAQSRASSEVRSDPPGPIQRSFESLQGWRFHILSGQPFPALDHHHYENCPLEIAAP